MRSKLADDADLLPLVRCYAAKLPRQVAEIADCFERGDVDGALDRLHRLKGAAGQYGFPQVSTLTQRIQNQAKDGKSVDAELRLLREQVDEIAREHAVD